MNSIFHRISVRKYEDKPVEKEKIMEILKAGMQAPSACNQQPWEFYVVTDKEKIQKLSKVTPYTGCAAGAPAVIVPVYHTEGLVAPSFAQIDMAIALENIWLTRNKYTIHKEVAISQVFHDNVTYDYLFYMGRFDFVVYEKRGKSELPGFAIELDGKEHFEDEVVRERDRQKNEICKAHHMQIIRVENSYARRYHYIKEILNDYFAMAR